MSLVDNIFDKNFSYVNKITFRILIFANISERFCVNLADAMILC